MSPVYKALLAVIAINVLLDIALAFAGVQITAWRLAVSDAMLLLLTYLASIHERDTHG